jgi:dihydroorotase
MGFELVLQGGRILDPSQNLDIVADLAFAGGKVAAVGKKLAAEAAVSKDVSGFLVTPGLIDLHTHVYWGGTSLGVDADEFCRASGVTTAIDTGSAGPGNFNGFRQHVIARSNARILAFLHISYAGIFGFSKTIMVGESEDMRLMAPADVVATIEAHRDVIVGVKVRVGRHASGASGTAPLDIALQAAEAVGLPLMAHIDEPPPNYEDVLARLRPGDILTHCFRPFPNTPVNAQGTVKPAVIAARKRGIVFDIGHGMGSFAFKTARAMLANGFQPDTISSDIHQLCIDGPVFDQVTTLSKMLCLGMSLRDVVAASTCTAATALKRLELGSLKPGSVGDATVLSLREGRFDYVDATGEHVIGNQRLFAEGSVLRGRWFHPDPFPAVGAAQTPTR